MVLRHVSVKPTHRETFDYRILFDTYVIPLADSIRNDRQLLFRNVYTYCVALSSNSSLPTTKRGRKKKNVNRTYPKCPEHDAARLDKRFSSRTDIFVVVSQGELRRQREPRQPVPNARAYNMDATIRRHRRRQHGGVRSSINFVPRPPKRYEILFGRASDGSYFI